MTEFRKIYSNVDELYVNWLYSKVGLETKEYGCYWRVIKRLFNVSFFVIVRHDVNRLKDAEHLRSEFAEEYHIDNFEELYSARKAITVLEVLVAFAMRIQSDIMWDPDNEDRTPLWFWSMIENLGIDLQAYQDGYFNANCIIELDEKINKALRRTYKRNGEGGFFPLRSPKKDQRKTELWYQMQFWINENYPI